MWVDVEGTEASVFEGAQTLLVRGVPLVVEPLFDSEGAERAAAAERLLQETYTHFLDLWARDFKEMPFRPLGALGDLAAAQRKKGLLFVRLPDQS